MQYCEAQTENLICDRIESIHICAATVYPTLQIHGCGCRMSKGNADDHVTRYITSERNMSLCQKKHSGNSQCMNQQLRVWENEIIRF